MCHRISACFSVLLLSLAAAHQQRGGSEVVEWVETVGRDGAPLEPCGQPGSGLTLASWAFAQPAIRRSATGKTSSQGLRVTLACSREPKDLQAWAPPPTGVAQANFSDTLATTGWTRLWVTSNHSYSDALQAYAGGYLEGVLTAHRIVEFIANTMGNSSGFSPPLQRFVQANMKWMEEQVALLQNSDPYWYQVCTHTAE